jgi:uncharacterized protein (DUF1778 family)
MNSTDDTLITLDLPIETIGRLALHAHERDMKLNDFIIDVMKEYAKEVVKNEKKPELLTE